jgi:hypothetical protein
LLDLPLALAAHPAPTEMPAAIATAAGDFGTKLNRRGRTVDKRNENDSVKLRVIFGDRFHPPVASSLEKSTAGATMTWFMPCCARPALRQQGRRSSHNPWCRQLRIRAHLQPAYMGVCKIAAEVTVGSCLCLKDPAGVEPAQSTHWGPKACCVHHFCANPREHGCNLCDSTTCTWLYSTCTSKPWNSLP